VLLKNNWNLEFFFLDNPQKCNIWIVWLALLLYMIYCDDLIWVMILRNNKP
jgi:hypothetical protein